MVQVVLAFHCTKQAALAGVVLAFVHFIHRTFKAEQHFVIELFFLEGKCVPDPEELDEDHTGEGKTGQDGDDQECLFFHASKIEGKGKPED